MVHVVRQIGRLGSGAQQSFGLGKEVEDGGLVEEGIPAELAADTESRYRTLLDAETALKDLWGKDTPWRRLRLDEGQLQETSAVGRDG